MNRLVRLVLLVAWVAGALAAGYTVEPGSSAPSGGERVLVRTEWVEFTAERNRLVLAMGHGEAAWRVATPVPSFAKSWLWGPETTPPSASRTSVAERAIVILFPSNCSPRP
jgi:hypothetical protein